MKFGKKVNNNKKKYKMFTKLSLKISLKNVLKLSSKKWQKSKFYSRIVDLTKLANGILNLLKLKKIWKSLKSRESKTQRDRCQLS